MENLSKNMILKTCFQTNENLLKTLNYVRKMLEKDINGPYSIATLENIIKNPMGLKQIFTNNNPYYINHFLLEGNGRDEYKFACINRLKKAHERITCCCFQCQ